MNTETSVESVETNEVSQSAVDAVGETIVHDSVADAISATNPTVVSSVATVKAKGKPGRKAQPDSNLQRAYAIYDRMAGAARKDVVVAFTAANIPKASANTYYHIIKNARVAEAASSSAAV